MSLPLLNSFTLCFIVCLACGKYSFHVCFINIMMTLLYIFSFAFVHTKRASQVKFAASDREEKRRTIKYITKKIHKKFSYIYVH